MVNKQQHTPADNSTPERPEAEPVQPENLQEQEDRQSRKSLQENILNIEAKKSDIKKNDY